MFYYNITIDPLAMKSEGQLKYYFIIVSDLLILHQEVTLGGNLLNMFYNLRRACIYYSFTLSY